MYVRLKLIVADGIAQKVVQLPDGLSPFEGMTICVNDEVGEFKVNEVEVSFYKPHGDESHDPSVALYLEAPVGFTTADWNHFVSWAES
jgi:hypothetical protein